MKIVRVNENQWLDLWTLTSFERKAYPESEGLEIKLMIERHQGPLVLFSGSDAQAVVVALEAAEVRAFPYPLAIGVPKESLEEEREAEARLGAFQRLRRFMFGSER
ncbi:MAG: hypothetical protein Q8K67_11175 [Geothrix sp.]|nr:hypothetical protein [Geothrix sp.]